MREILETLLTREGYDVSLARRTEGLEMARATRFAAAICRHHDARARTAIATLDELKRIDRGLAVVIITCKLGRERISHEGGLRSNKSPSTFKNDEVIVVGGTRWNAGAWSTRTATSAETSRSGYHKFANNHRHEPRSGRVFAHHPAEHAATI